MNKKRLEKQRREEAKAAEADKLRDMKAMAEFTMFIKDFGGKSHVARVYDAMSIDKLRELVEKKTGIPPNKQCLVYGRKTVMGGKIGDYGMESDGDIRLTGGLCGFVLNYSKFVVYFYKKIVFHYT